MDWFDVLKMPNPHGGKWDTLTSDEYYKMDDKNKQYYHDALSIQYFRQIKQAVTPRRAGQAPPATDDQIRGLRELYRFHKRQHGRLEHKRNKENYYSLEEEQNREMHKPTYDAVERIPHTTKEMYDKYTREQKIKYWGRLTNQLRDEYGIKHPKRVFAERMYRRMRTTPNYNPPFEGDESTSIEFRTKYRHRDVNEYDDFTDREKINYHSRMEAQGRKEGNKELARFHIRMIGRVRKNSPLPIYPTPEAEKEA